MSPLASNFACICTHFDLRFHAITIKKPSFHFTDQERDFILSLTGYDVDKHCEDFYVHAESCVMRGLIVMSYDKDIFLFRVVSESEWILQGCYITVRSTCKTIRTSDIPKHWQIFHYVGCANSDIDGFLLHLNGFPDSLCEISIQTCCEKLKVSMDWNDIPFATTRIRIRLKNQMLLSEFGFLFDVDRVEYDHKRVAIDFTIKEGWLSSFDDIVTNELFRKEAISHEEERTLRVQEV